MKKINIKEHTDKYLKLSKKAASGIYPNIKISKAGSKVGIGLGVTLLGIGVYNLNKSALIGVGSLIGGTTTLLSNIFNLKRIKKD